MLCCALCCADWWLGGWQALVVFRNKAFTDKLDKEKYLRKQNDKPAPKPAKVVRCAVLCCAVLCGSIRKVKSEKKTLASHLHSCKL